VSPIPLPAAFISATKAAGRRCPSGQHASDVVGGGDQESLQRLALGERLAGTTFTTDSC
jgi:hypothetical protein